MKLGRHQIEFAFIASHLAIGGIKTEMGWVISPLPMCVFMIGTFEEESEKPTTILEDIAWVYVAMNEDGNGFALQEDGQRPVVVAFVRESDCRTAIEAWPRKEGMPLGLKPSPVDIPTYFTLCNRIGADFRIVRGDGVIESGKAVCLDGGGNR